MRIFENRFNTDIVKPVLEKVVLVGKTVTGIKFKVTQRNFVEVIRKSDPAGVGNAVIFALNGVMGAKLQYDDICGIQE